MEKSKARRTGIIICILLALGLLIYLLRNVLLPVFIAMALAYLLDPVVHRLEGRRINRSLAIIILAVVTMLVLAGIGIFLFFQIQRETVILYKKLPGYFARVQKQVGPIVKMYFGVEISDNWDETVASLKEQLSKMDSSKLKPVSSYLGRLTLRTFSLLSWLLGLLIVPIFLVYFLYEWGQFKERITSYIPLAYRGYLLRKFDEVDEVLSGFIHGQLTVCFILGILYSLGLVIIGVDLAIVIGMISGLAFIIPYFGTALGIVLASLMSLLENGLSWQLIGVWAVFAVVQFFESYFITPRIVGKKVGLKPIIVILAVLIGADLLGFLGVLVAVPVSAVLNVFLKDILDYYKKSSFFLEKPDSK